MRYMGPDRDGYPDDVPRPDVVPVHMALWLGHIANARKLLRQAKNYSGDARKRLEDDSGKLEEMFKRMGPDLSVEPEPVEEPLGPEEATELAALMLSEGQMRSEILAFCHTWIESVNCQRRLGSPLVEDALDYEVFGQVFSRLAETCRIPDLRDRRRP
jgi:hypothetical protein